MQETETLAERAAVLATWRACDMVEAETDVCNRAGKTVVARDLRDERRRRSDTVEILVERRDPRGGQLRLLPREVQKVEQPVHVVHSRRIEIANDDVGAAALASARDQIRQPRNGGDPPRIGRVVARPFRREQTNFAGIRAVERECQFAVHERKTVRRLERPLDLIPQRGHAAVRGFCSNRPGDLDALLAQKALQLIEQCGAFELPNPLALLDDHRATQRAILQHRTCERSDSLRMLVVYQQSCAAERRFDVAARVSNHRNIEGHRFDQRDAEPLVVAQAQKQCCGAIPAVQIGVRHLPRKADNLAQLEFIDQLAQFEIVRFLFAVSADEGDLKRTRHNGAQLGSRLDDVSMCLVRRDAPNEQDGRNLRLLLDQRIVPLGRADARGIDQQRNRFDLLVTALAKLLGIQIGHRYRRSEMLAKRIELRTSFHRVMPERRPFVEERFRRDVVIDEDRSTRKTQNPLILIVSHRVMQQHHVVRRSVVFPEVANAANQFRSNMFREYLGFETELAQQRLDHEHAVRHRVGNRASGMKLVDRPDAS
nr:hypothetical protein [Burkholderia cenocepacia]